MRRVHLRRISELVLDILKQGRLHVLPLTFGAILAGAASISQLDSGIILKSFLYSILVNFIASAPNDYFDRRIDSNNSRKNYFGNKVEKKNIALTVTTLSLILGFLVALFASSYQGLSLLFVTLISILYSVPPVRLKGRAPLDLISNSIGVFLIFSIGVGVAGGTFSQVIPGAYWFSLILGGFHSILAIFDIEEDKKEDLITTPILIGRKPTVILTQIIILTALIFEQFSKITQAFLIISALGLTLFWSQRSKRNTLLIIVTGIVISSIYLILYSVLRGF